MALATGLATGFAAVLLITRFTGRARRPLERAVLAVRVARMLTLSPSQFANASQDLRLLSFYLGRSRSGLRPVLSLCCTYRFALNPTSAPGFRTVAETLQNLPV
jgi:hypothetical protein